MDNILSSKMTVIKSWIISINIEFQCSKIYGTWDATCMYPVAASEIFFKVFNTKLKYNITKKKIIIHESYSIKEFGLLL